MNVLPFPPRRTVAPPKLDLLGRVFAAMARIGEPASAAEVAAMVAEGVAGDRVDRVLGEVEDILDFYSRTPLVELRDGRVFRRMGERFDYTSEFRAHMAHQGFHQMLRGARRFDGLESGGLAAAMAD